MQNVLLLPSLMNQKCWQMNGCPFSMPMKMVLRVMMTCPSIKWHISGEASCWLTRLGCQNRVSHNISVSQHLGSSIGIGFKYWNPELLWETLLGESCNIGGPKQRLYKKLEKIAVQVYLLVSMLRAARQVLWLKEKSSGRRKVAHHFMKPTIHSVSVYKFVPLCICKFVCTCLPDK